MPRKPATDAPLSQKAQRAANLAALTQAFAPDADGGDSFVAEKVRQGLALEDEKVKLYERIDANRTLIRTFVTSGDIAPDDAEMLYPTKKAKNGDDAEAAS